MTHKFDVSSKSKLDNPKRREKLPPYETLIRLGLKQKDVTADIGCGIGYFSIPAAQIVGKDGLVYAMDISSEMIEEIDKKALENNIKNIKPILTEENDLKLTEKAVTFAFMCTVLHEVEDTAKFINEVKRILDNGGRLAIIEWVKTESDWGPPADHRLGREEVIDLLKMSGFRDISAYDLNEYFYVVNAKR